jgi:glucose-1-phosphate thymidylyltransferase
MQCVILAAGYATRLYPLTENFPKPLLKVGDRTILDWLVDDIETSGVAERYVVVSNHKFAGHFEAWAKEKKLPVTVVDDGTCSNETRLGAVKDVQLAVDRLGIDDDLLVIAGDNVLDFSLAHFIRYAADKGTSCCMRYYEPDLGKLKKRGISVVGEGDLLLELVEKSEDPKSHWCTPPFYYYTAEDVKKIPEALADGCGTDAPGSLVAWMCRHSVMHSMEMPGKRYDIGDIDSYKRVLETYEGIKT